MFDIVKDEMKDLEMMKFYKLEHQLGVTKARQFAAQHATGDVIAFLDSHCKYVITFVCDVTDSDVCGRRVLRGLGRTSAATD